MAEGFDQQYHVPQQSRRDKLRVVNTTSQGGCVDYVPLYDPSSLISSDLLTCTSAANLHHHRQSFNLDPNKDMGFSHMYVNPSLNPSSSTTVQDISSISSAQFMYNTSPQNYRAVLDDEQSFHHHHHSTSNNNSTNVVVGYKPHESLSTMVNGGQSLSLSLSSHNTQNCSNSTVPLELNSVFGSGNKANSNEGFFVAGNGIELSRSSVPLGPFTGYATVLKKSRFLRPAQQLLEEFCDGGRGVYGERIAPDSSLLDHPPLLSGNDEVVDDDASVSFSDGSEQIRKKSRLLSMLDEVYKRYKLYYQQMQAVVSSFESVAGLSNAAPFASLALKSLSKHFKCLKNTITEQLQCTIKYHGKANYERDGPQRLENAGMQPHAQRTFHSTRFVEQPVWRPQRGLPERAVSVLRAWLFEHFLHPYPTDTDKMMLAKQTGLSRNQVSNWFINARVRLWKPMVEEIHMLETRQSQKHPQREESSANRLNDHLPTSSSIDCENASTSFQAIGEFPLKRSREELTEAHGGSNRPMNLRYENLSHHPHLGGAGVGGSGSGGGGVSLTLGLHQNGMGLSENGMGLSESYPINAARRFGLDAHGEGYMLSGFAAQNRQYGRDVIG